PTTPADAGVSRPRRDGSAARQLMFFHGTTWATKHWPESYWRLLAQHAVAENIAVSLPWGDETERLRAESIARDLVGVTVLPRMSLSALFELMLQQDAFVAVDTGLAHLACAAGLPGVVLYGPTNPGLTGAYGRDCVTLAVDFSCAPCMQARCKYADTGETVHPPCFATLSPDLVWRALCQRAGWSLQESP